jgi:hypothetical protein
MIADALCAAEKAQLLGVDVKRVVQREVVHLLRQSLVDARPAFGAISVKPLDGRIDLTARSFGHTAKFLGREDDSDVATLTLHAHRLCLRHVDELAETVLGVGSGEGFHKGEISRIGRFRQYYDSEVR